MTNLEIICKEAIEAQLYTEEEVEAILMTGRTLPIHTFAIWKKMGYSIKKGEHARIVTKLWKPSTKKYTVTNKDGEEEEKTENNMYLVKSFLFTKDQVEAIA